MAEREATFQVKLGGDDTDLRRLFDVFRSTAKATVSDIERTTSNVELFKGAAAGADKASAAFKELSARVADYKAKIDAAQAAGEPVSKGLTEGLKQAQRALADNFKELTKQTAAVERLGATLKTAGVDVSRLASEELRLAAAVKVAAAAEADRQAKAALGLRTLKDIAPEIAKLQAAYQALASSGTLSTKELAAAQLLLKTRTAELQAQVTGLGQAATRSGPDLISMFQGAVLPALGITATLAGVVAALGAANDSARQFKQGVAEIGTVTDLSKAQLDALGLGARALARELGIDVNQALRGLFDLIRSGVPPENALEALRVAAIASKAAVTDLADGVKAADALVSGFGASVGDIGPLLDAVAVGAKNGGATLKEFGENAGPLLAIARAANVPLNELIATLTVMVDATGNAGQSFGDLGKIIQRINTTEAREKLRGLGIEGNSLVEIFRQLGERGLALDQILELGVASTKSAAGVAALTSNAVQLPEVLEKIGGSAGTAARALAELFDSPKERAARFNAQVNEASINIGNLVGSGSRLAQIVRPLVEGFNQGNATFRAVNRTLDEGEFSFKRYFRALTDGNPLATEAARAQQLLAIAAQGTADQNDRLAASIERANTALRDFAPRLLADIQAIQQASARDIADAQTRADAQIAALDRTAEATKKTAAETLAIQTQLAADRLAIIVKAEADVTAALEKAIAARSASARKAGEDEKKIAADAAQARLAALVPILVQYQAHYSALVGQAQSYAAKLQSIESERVSFNRGIEQALFGLRLGALSVFDQYVEKVRETERLISLAREAGAKGDLQTAKQYTSEAITLAQSLGTVTNERGIQIVTALQAQAEKQRLVKQAADGYNTTLGEQAKAAKDGADATKQGIDAVVPKLNDLRDRYDGLKKTIAEGLDVKVKLDSESVAAAFRTLDDLAKPRETTLTVRVKRIEENAAGGLVGEAARGFARGGSVGSALTRAVQAFATGGPVFRKPAWNKVPGTGNQDTVAAGLQSGSYVVKKAASQFYGDAVMSNLARGIRHFATGGKVKTRWDDVSTGTSKAPETPRPTVRDDGTPIFYKADGSEESAFFGDRKGADTIRSFSADDVFGAPTLPSDPRELERLIFGYANAVVRASIIDGGRNGRVFGAVIRTLELRMKDYENRPTPEKLGYILNQARGIGLNIGITTGTRQGFDIDGRKFHKKAAKAPAGLANAKLYSYDFYREGGEAEGRSFSEPRPFGQDTVRAMLTPGEYVMSKPAVQAVTRRFGSGFLDALNSMKLPRVDVDAMLRPPPVERFAEGGRVGDAAIPASAFEARRPGGGATYNTVNVTAAAGALLSPENVRRFILPVFDDIARRSK